MNSIHRRLTTGLLIGFCLLGGGGGLILYLAMRSALTVEFDQTLRANANALVALTQQNKGKIEFDFPGEFVPGFEHAKAPDYFEVWFANGTTLKRSSSLKNSDLPRPTIATDSTTFWNLTLPDGLPGRAVGILFVPRREDEAEGLSEKVDSKDVHPASRAPITLVVARHRMDLDHRLQMLGTILLLVGAGGVAGTGFVVKFVVSRGLLPLSELAQRAAAINATSLHLRFPVEEMPVELKPICERLNDSLARLEMSFERERRFSADVAHELRTPIAELRSLAEVALKWPDDAESNAQALRDALDVALQMEALATGLLNLARCEAGLQPITRQPVRIAALVKEIWRSLETEAIRKKIAVSWEVSEETCLQTDPVMFRSILTNLLTNAVEYCPNGGAIRLQAETTKQGFDMRVGNTVDNLSSDDLPHLFERFWRKDAARSASIHSGLGLALAKAFAGALGLHFCADLTLPATLMMSLSERTQSGGSTKIITVNLNNEKR